jgi:hypothetical protein
MKKKKNLVGKVILASVLFLIIAQVIHSLGAMATMNYYMLEQFFPMWSNIMMPDGGAPGGMFYALSAIFNLITGLIFALVFLAVGEGLKQKDNLKKGLLYGFLVFCIASIPGALSMVLLLNLPAMLIFVWTIEALIIYLIMGMINGKMLA